MRIIFFVFLIMMAYFYFRPTGSSGLPKLAEIADTINNVRSSIPWPGKDAEDGLNIERTRSEVRDQEIISLRDKLARAATNENSRNESLQSCQSASQRSVEETQSERNRADALAAQLVALQREVSSQLDAVKTQLDDQTLRAARLANENDVAHAQLAKAAAQIAAFDAAQRSWDEGTRASAQTIQEEHERVKTLAAQMASLQQDAASQIEAFKTKLDDKRKCFERDNAVARTAAKGGAWDESGSDQSTRIASTEGPQRYSVPDQVPIRVIVRYARDSDSARARAINFTQVLQARGVRIVDLANAPLPIAADSLTYFYNNDRSIATDVANILPALRSRLHQSKPGNTVPRPGVIEIEVSA